jgi:hypothetical protein
MSWLKITGCLVLMSAVCLAEPSGNSSPQAVGQVLAGSARVDGITVPSGTTLFSQSSVATGERPAAIRLVTGDLLQLNQNSSVSFDRSPDNRVQVAVNSGTLSYRYDAETAATAESPAALSFPQRRTGAPVPGVNQQSGVFTFLTGEAPKGSTRITVTDASRLDPEARTMIRTRDGKLFQIQYLKSMKGNVLHLTTPLAYDFHPEDMIIQGCECDEALGLPADGVVAILTESVDKGNNSLQVRALGLIDPDAHTLVKRKDGSIQEVHRIEGISGGTIYLKDKLKFAFEPGDMLIQGCSVPPFTGVGWFTPSKLLWAGGGAGTTIIIKEIIEKNNWEEICSLCEELRPK